MRSELAALLACTLMLAGCDGSSAERSSAVLERAVSITAAVAEARPVRVVERTLGPLRCPEPYDAASEQLVAEHFSRSGARPLDATLADGTQYLVQSWSLFLILRVKVAK